MAKADRPVRGKDDKPNQADKCFYGVATVGERGQIVIPADLRKDLEIAAGDKLMLWTHPSGKGIMLFPVEEMRDFMNMMLANLEHAERALAVPQETKPEAKAEIKSEPVPGSKAEPASESERAEVNLNA